MTRQHAKLGTLLLVLLALVGCGITAQSKVHRQTEAAHDSTWYYFNWMAEAPYAPTFHVLDTESSLGPYAEQLKTITLQDLVKMHGHPCDGLVTAACAMSVGLGQLYPNGAIDRTDTCCVTNNSPCYGDVAAYLTGGRIRFGTQKIDPSMGNAFVLYRRSTRQAVEVSLRPGVFPQQVAALESKIRAGDFTAAEMDQCQQWQWDYARKLMQEPLRESFQAKTLEGFSWEPDPYPNVRNRGDIINKNVGCRCADKLIQQLA